MIVAIIYITLILLFFDYFYLSLIKKTFNKMFLKIQNKGITVKYPFFIITYIFIALGIYHFTIKRNMSLTDSFLLGLFVYGVYELVNYTTFDNWLLPIVLIDSIWGGILFSLTTFITRKLIN